ncbi:hypothetical protein COLO4_36601 [Corchorus olitorius]|uniref:Uncharacterized protein n=1 Tax=Corchorus olitorius TaxID=93759 RepID=A0A1R3G7H1_9ROSI|nr:hypothetical protein COLO4_36601 [Corchorus olitorius]
MKLHRATSSAERDGDLRAASERENVFRVSRVREGRSVCRGVWRVETSAERVREAPSVEPGEDYVWEVRWLDELETLC